MPTRKKTDDVNPGATPEDDPWASDNESARFGTPNGTNETVNGAVDNDEFDDGGLFDGVDDIEDVDNDPFFMPDDVYLWSITEAVRKRSKTGKMGLNIKLKCAEGPFKGNTQWGPWRRVPLASDAEFADMQENEETKFKFRKMQAQLRADMESFGIPADELKSVKADKQGNMTALLNLQVKGRVKNVTDENNVKQRKIVAYYPVDEVSGEDGQGGFGQFASDFKEPEY